MLISSKMIQACLVYYSAGARPKISLYHHDPIHQSVVVRIVAPITTMPPRINPNTGSP